MELQPANKRSTFKIISEFILIFIGLAIFLLYLFTFLYSTFDFTSLDNVIGEYFKNFESFVLVLVLVFLLIIFLLTCFIFWLLKRNNWFFRGISILWVAAIVVTAATLRQSGWFNSPAEFFLLFSLLSIPLFIIGLIRPSLILRFRNPKYQTRKFSSLLFGATFIGFFILFSVFGGSDVEQKSTYQVNQGMALSATLVRGEDEEGWISPNDYAGIKISEPKQEKTLLYGKEQEAVKLSSSDEKTASRIQRKVIIPANAEVFSFCYYFPVKGDGDWLTVHFDQNLEWTFSGQNGELQSLAKGNYMSFMRRSSISILPQDQGSERTIYITLHGSGTASSEVILTQFAFLNLKDILSRHPEPTEPECWTEKRGQ